MALLGIYWMCLIVFNKFSTIFNIRVIFIAGWWWKSKNFENFSVGVQEFEITFDNLLFILRSKYILPKVVPFWYSCKFFFSNFTLTFETPKHFITLIYQTWQHSITIFISQLFSTSTIALSNPYIYARTLIRLFDYYAAIICQTSHGCQFFSC